ncbi:MAG TPA: hypothetical protein ENJ95_10800 [Bacteroidetes bacterium]|nr:hypothetical protein [Bacteroidota bacterium]
MRIFYSIFPLLLLAVLSTGQTTQTEFGKNRVQYSDQFKEWSEYESRNFITYWYGDGRLVGQSVVQMAEYDFYEIQGILEHRMNDKIEIIVYTDLTDLKQSNIGSEEAFVNTGGQTKIVGNKMFVHYNGDHNDLRRQIREGVASVYLNAMLFGSNLQEIVQNAVMMNLPEWFKQGLISFVGQEWSTDLDNELRDLFQSGKYENFEEMADEHPQLAGHSLWHFISQHYGYSTVANLLYLTRINRSVESGFLYVLGNTYEKTVESWDAFFLERYENELKTFDATRQLSGKLKVKNKRKSPMTQLKISPDGTKIAYVINEIGRTKVYIQDLATGDRSLVHKEGFRNAIQATDYNYPLLAWNPNNMELGIIYEHRDKVFFTKYDFLTKDKTTEEMNAQFQRIYSMDYVNVNDLVFSAAVRGQSDLFLYYSQTRQSQRLTTDFWDDLDASFVQVNGQRGILFASNRPDSLNVRAPLDSILPITTFDIFYLNLDSVGFKTMGELVQVTHTPLANERAPVGIDNTWFSFLTDETGVVNRKTGYLEDYIHHFENIITFDDGTEMRMHADTVIAEKLDSVAYSKIASVKLDTIVKQRAINHFTTNYDRNIVEQHKARRNNRYVEMIYRDGVYDFYMREMDATKTAVPAFSGYQKQRVRILEMPVLEEEGTKPKTKLEEAGNEPIDVSDEPVEKLDTGKIDIDNYLFQSEFDDDEVPVQLDDDDDKTEEVKLDQSIVYKAVEEEDDSKKVHDFRSSRIIPYRLKFRTDFVTTQLDNGLLFDGLNTFAGVPQDFGYPPPGILLKANFKDLFEDYEFEGGIRVPTSFNGAEYFAYFYDKKKRLDKRYAVYRRRLRFTLDPAPPPIKYDNSTFLMQYQVRYPLDIYTSIRGSATLRFDKTVVLSSDQQTLEVPSQKTQRFGIKGEFVFDNTLDISLNIKNGTRYKIFAEMVKGFEVDLGQDFSFSANDGFMTVIGLDARHYQRVMKWSVLAGRLAGATSFGKEKILYMLGGTDSWLLPSFNDEIPLPTSGNFVYRSIATNARGFQMNARNGNSYAVFNAEFRMPVLRYLFRRSASNFVRNFQVIGFFDAGTAWEGINPFNETSPLNTWRDSNSNVDIEVNFFRDPIVFGYGGGVRTLLFGYFVRLDYAWGVDTRERQDPRLYFSIGMDF